MSKRWSTTHKVRITVMKIASNLIKTVSWLAYHTALNDFCLLLIHIHVINTPHPNCFSHFIRFFRSYVHQIKWQACFAAFRLALLCYCCGMNVCEKDYLMISFFILFFWVGKLRASENKLNKNNKNQDKQTFYKFGWNQPM